MTYSEFQDMYSKAYAEAEIKAAEIAAIEEQIRNINELNVTEDIKNVNREAFNQNMTITADEHLFGISKEVTKQQMEELLNDASAVNAQIEYLEQRKENVYVALADSYSTNELGDLIPVVNEEVEILKSKPNTTSNEQEYLNTSETILTALKKLDIQLDEILPDKTTIYLNAINHLNSVGIHVDSDDFAEHFAKTVNRDIEIAVNNGDNVKDVVESIRESLSRCEYIDETLKEAADKSLDKIIEAEASFDLE